MKIDGKRTVLILPLFYLTITSGLPPGDRVTEIPRNSSLIMETLKGINSGTTSAVLPDSKEPTMSLADAEKLITPPTHQITSAVPDSNPPGTNTFNNQADPHHFTEAPVISPLVQNITKVPLRGRCNISSQCIGEWTECRYNVCKCMSGYLPRIDDGNLCGEESLHFVSPPQTDPTMIGVVLALALMSVTLCVVLRLFAKARFRENRTIFNTPNPRLMNVSLLKGSKPLMRGNSAPRSRRGSTISARSGAEAGTPSSPVRHLEPVHAHDAAGGGNGGSGAAVAGSSRPKASRQMSTDTVGSDAPTPHSTKHSSSAVNKNRFRHQESVQSNV